MDGHSLPDLAAPGQNSSPSLAPAKRGRGRRRSGRHHSRWTSTRGRSTARAGAARTCSQTSGASASASSEGAPAGASRGASAKNPLVSSAHARRSSRLPAWRPPSRALAAARTAHSSPDQTLAHCQGRRAKRRGCPRWHGTARAACASPDHTPVRSYTAAPGTPACADCAASRRAGSCQAGT
jgi:hypothetical protein